MEMVLNNGFCELTQGEMFMVEGGNMLAEIWNEACKDLTVLSASAIAGAKVGAATCTPVGVLAGAVVGAIVGTVWDNVF